MICGALMDMGVFCTLQDESDYLNHNITPDILQTILVDGEIPDDLDFDELNARILENYKEQSCDQVEKEYGSNLANALNNPSQYEISTWAEKREAALAYQEGNATDYHLATLDTYAAPRGETIANYVQIVITKHTAHKDESARLEGIKKQLKDQVKAALNINEIDEILQDAQW